MKILYIIPALFLAGCASNTTIGSVTLGECQIVHTPQYEVLGKTAYDRQVGSDHRGVPGPWLQPAETTEAPSILRRQTQTQTSCHQTSSGRSCAARQAKEEALVEPA